MTDSFFDFLLLFDQSTGALASVPVMLNSFIHILMYTYYFLSTFGPEWQKKLETWKPKLTLAQMVSGQLLTMNWNFHENYRFNSP